ncbi:MAG: N-acetylmuramoyl-L-alanine amidase [Oscillospiraceae bacterium]|nr:N-acetylmuramoyl-L-alanine amidase [Oscillospiraceae bacterium]
MTAVNGIVVHYVGNPGSTARQNRSYFAKLALTHATYASSNFIIGLDGEILLCVPIGEVAFCSNDRNDDTLSIEVCHPDDTGEFTPESYESLVRLVRWLAEFYELDEEDILRHYDIRGKECPRYFVQNPEAWEEFKTEVFAPLN